MSALRELFFKIGFDIKDGPLQRANQITNAFRDKFNKLGRAMESFGGKFDSMTDIATKNMNRTVTAIAGATATAQEHNQNLNKIKTTYMTLGGIINGYVTPALLAMGAGIAIVGSRYEEMSNKFQAQTLAKDSFMPALRKEMVDTQIATGAAFSDVGNVFSYLRNQMKIADKNLKSASTTAFAFADAWGQNDAESAIQAYSGLSIVMQKLGVNQERAADMFAIAMRNNQGDAEAATNEILNQANAYKKTTAAGTEGATAFERMRKALDQGPFATFGEGLRNLRAGIISIYEGMKPSLQNIANGFLKISQSINSFLEQNPKIAAFIGKFALFGSITTIVTGGLLTFTSILMTVTKNASKLGQKLNFMLRAVAGLPRMLSGLMPMLLQGFMALPGIVGKFALSFIRLNPALSAFMLAGYLIQQNWERFGPIVTRIFNDIKTAFQPLINAFEETSSSVWPKITSALNKIADIASNVLMVSLQTIEPVIHSISQAMNGDFTGSINTFKQAASTAFNNLFGPATDGIKRFGTILAGTVIAWGTFTTATKIAKVAMVGINTLFRANPLGLLISAAGLLYTAWTQNWGGIQQKVAAVINWLKPTFIQVAAFAIQNFNKITLYLKSIWPLVTQVFNQVKGYFISLWPSIVNTFSVSWAVIKGVVTVGATLVWNTIKTAFTTAWEVVKTVMQGIWNVIKIGFTLIGGIVKTGLQLLTGDFKGAWNTIKETASSVFQQVKKTISDFVSGAIDIGKTFLTGIAKGFISGLDAVLEAAKGVWEAIKAIFSDQPVIRPKIVMPAGAGTISDSGYRVKGGMGVQPHAMGGIFSKPHLGLVAEAGYPEAIIPLGANVRDRGIAIWQKAGEMLGVSQTQPTPSLALDSGTVPTPVRGGSGGNTTVHIEINVTGGSNPQETGESVVQALRREFPHLFDRRWDDKWNQMIAKRPLVTEY